MFHYIRGQVSMKFEGGIVLETGGIGYEIFVPDNSTAYLMDFNQELLVYTNMIIREDAVSIYGFTDRDSLDTFKRLMTVNGVGAKAALSLLSSMPLLDLKKAIVYEDALMLTKAQGIGKKIAQRIVLELKDKMQPNTPDSVMGKDTKGLNDEKDEAIVGLMTLGYSRSEAAEAVNSVKLEKPSTEAYMKEALKGLLRR